VNNVTENHHQNQQSEKKGLDLLNSHFVSFFIVLLLSIQWAERGVNTKNYKENATNASIK